jgi:ABC-2 type transport system permease protein
MIFDFPLNGKMLDLVAFFVPYFLAVIFFSMVVQRAVPDRESTFVVFVFTSVAFVFLSGVSWPRYAMKELWQLVGDCIPSTWGINGVVGMNTAGATLQEQSEPYIALWVLAMVYFGIALVLEKRKPH